jgi:maltose alpha-D-glucosyltransferase/alpha-amylase
VLWYGEEIGMGDDLELEERESVRTPMQWSAHENGGFSSAHPAKVVRPVVDEGKFSYTKVNVERQQSDRRSLLNAVERMIRTRKECPEFGWGEFRILNAKPDTLLAHVCEWRGGAVLAIHNLLSDQRYDLPDDGLLKLNLEPFACRWFRLRSRRAEGTQ